MNTLTVFCQEPDSFFKIILFIYFKELFSKLE